MLKTGKEYELERLNDTLEKELDLIEQKLLVSTKRSREKLDAIYPKVSSLNKLVSNIEN